MDTFESLESTLRSYSRNWDTVLGFAAGSADAAEYATGEPVT